MTRRARSDREPMPVVPRGAIGFIAARPDRPERLALFRTDGTLSNSFAQDQDIEAVRSALRRAGLTVDEQVVYGAPGN